MKFWYVIIVYEPTNLWKYFLKWMQKTLTFSILDFFPYFSFITKIYLYIFFWESRLGVHRSPKIFKKQKVKVLEFVFLKTKNSYIKIFVWSVKKLFGRVYLKCDTAKIAFKVFIWIINIYLHNVIYGKIGRLFVIFYIFIQLW